MQVFHLIDSGGFYGAERVLLELAKEQIKAGYLVSVVSCGARGCGEKALEAECKKSCTCYLLARKNIQEFILPG